MAVLTNDTDIVFIVDVSGSMGSYITKVRNALNNFVDSLTAENISYRLGLVEFESTAKIYDFTDDVEQFKSDLQSLSLYGGTENGLSAIQTTLGMEFREGVAKRLIMITDENYDDYRSVITSDTIISQLNGEGVILDVVGSVYNGKAEYEPIANATGGQFYDISAMDYTPIFNDIAEGIIIATDRVTINLNDVGESETGVFVVTSYVTDSGDTATSSVATFKATAEDSDTIVGTVTADKVYVAESGLEYRQNITIPEKWSVTASENNDYLNITGDSVTVAGGEGNDRFYVASGVSEVVFADFTPADDSISFATRIEPGSLTRSTLEEHLVLLAEEINLTFQNTSILTTELYNEEVNNGGDTNTIGELVDGIRSDSNVVINPSSPLMMSLSHWSYGFNPQSE